MALFVGVFAASVPSQRHNNALGERLTKAKTESTAVGPVRQNAVIQAGQITNSIGSALLPFVIVGVVVVALLG